VPAFDQREHGHRFGQEAVGVGEEYAVVDVEFVGSYW
jgi:hypothetical protein